MPNCECVYFTPAYLATRTRYIFSSLFYAWWCQYLIVQFYPTFSRYCTLLKIAALRKLFISRVTLPTNQVQISCLGNILSKVIVNIKCNFDLLLSRCIMYLSLFFISKRQNPKIIWLFIYLVYLLRYLYKYISLNRGIYIGFLTNVSLFCRIG